MTKLLKTFFLLILINFSCNEKSINYSEEAKSKLDQGLPKEAISILEKGIKKNPEDAKLHNLKGVALYMQDEFGNAILSFEKAIRYDSSNYQYHYNVGNAYRNLRNLDAALTSYSNAIFLDSLQSDCYLNRGLVKMSLNNTKSDMVEDFNKAVELAPKNAMAYLHRGRAHMVREAFEEAIPDLEMAIEINQDFGDAYYNLALAKTALKGADEEVCFLLQKASDLGNAQAKNAIGQYCL